MSWLRYSNQMLAAVNTTVTNKEHVVIYDIEYFEKLSDILIEHMLSTRGKR